MSEQTSQFALTSSQVVTTEGSRPAAVVVEQGKILAVTTADQVPAEVPSEDVGDLVIAPGVIDSHVHINEPGRTDWEGFETATRAAAAGGVTTLVDMPLNSDPVTTTVAALETKRASAAGKCWVDVGFYGGFVGENLADVALLVDAGVCGIKCFLCPSGLDEFPAVGESQLRQAMPILASRGVPLLVHAELVDGHRFPPGGMRSYQDWLSARPATLELNAVRMMLALCAEFQCPVHIVHLSSALATKLLADTSRGELPLTVETCPHYLHFCAEHLQLADTRLKCAPAIKGQQDRNALWQGLGDGTINTIGSDHSPCPPELKCLEAQDFSRAWGGIASLELTLPVVWTGARRREIPLWCLAEWLSHAPARLIGLANRKGRIAPGMDADLVVWDPQQQWVVDQGRLHHRHPVTPYNNESLLGRVRRTYVRGQVVFNGDRVSELPHGQLLRRE